MITSQRARRARELLLARRATIPEKMARFATSVLAEQENQSLPKALSMANLHGGSGLVRTQAKQKNGSVARLSEPLESFSRAFGRALVQNLDVPSLAAKYG